MRLDPLIIGIMAAGGYGLTIWLIKRWFIQLNKRLDEQDRRYWICREENATKFADKTNTREHIAGLFQRVEDLKVETARCGIKSA